MVMIRVDPNPAYNYDYSIVGTRVHYKNVHNDLQMHALSEMSQCTVETAQSG